MTSLAETGAGTLKACIDASGPRVCVFEVGGTIKLHGPLSIRNPNITIAGQTAPWPGIMLRGDALRISTSDVLVQHIRVRVGDEAGSTYDNRDGLRIESAATNPIKNIVVDHCSFSWSIDETASVYEGTSNVSLLNNIFADALNESFHSKGRHGYGLLVGGDRGQSVDKLSMIGNVMANLLERNPLSRANSFVMVNNVVYNWGNAAVSLQSYNFPTLNTIVGNVFSQGPDYASGKPIILRSGDELAMVSGSKVYVSDTVAVEATSDPWSVVSYKLASVKVTSIPVWPDGLQALRASETKEKVLATAGARRKEADPVDSRIIEGVRSGTGRIINCVTADGSERCKQNAGGWPSTPQRTRALTLPANYNAISASGYTNLELWLHKMAAEVEGKTGVQPKPPSGVTVE